VVSNSRFLRTTGLHTNHRIDDHPIAGQTLFDNPRRLLVSNQNREILLRVFLRDDIAVMLFQHRFRMIRHKHTVPMNTAESIGKAINEQQLPP
jgi:hypothetical protein